MRLTQYKRGTGSFRELLSKALLLVATGLLCLWMISGARAASIQVSDVKSVQGSGNIEVIRIAFSQTVTPDLVSAEFQRNFLQLSLRGVSAFPAKNSTVPGGEVEKVFIYQYQPDLARARILFKRDAAAMQSQVQWEIKDKVIEVRITKSEPIAIVKATPKIHTDKIKLIAAGVSKAPAPVLETAAADIAPTQEIASADDAEMIRKILNEDGKAAPTPAILATEAAKPTEELNFTKTTVKEAIKEKNNNANPIRKMLTGLMVVLSLMAAVAYGFKRFVLKGGKINLGFGGLSRSSGMIEMISSYMLGPKKSIAVVRIGQQMMVLGITEGNISLIQNLGSDAGLDKYLDDMPTPSAPGFDAVFAKKLETPESETLPAATKQSIRNLIKQRIEGFKPL